MPDAFTLPAGYGIRLVPPAEFAERSSLFDVLLVWEPPRRRGDGRPPAQYVLGVDTGDGLGLDRSVCTVVRVPTLEEPAEEVAQFVSDGLAPSQFAYIVDTVGHLYCDREGYEAQAAIEINNHGLSVQDTLQQHLGYSHFYVWEYLDAADPAKRFTPRIGWQTTPRTRPLLLDKFYAGVTVLDPVSHTPDFRLNSPLTFDELADFQTEGALWEAAAARGAHDDCLMAAAIGYYVSYRMAGGEIEPLADRRRRTLEEKAARDAAALSQGGLLSKRDWRNTDVTADDADRGYDPDEIADEDFPLPV